jgi:hypothetical protein
MIGLFSGIIHAFESEECAGNSARLNHFRKLSIEYGEPILDELAGQEIDVPNRIGAAPVAVFDGIGIGVTERPHKNPIR